MSKFTNMVLALLAVVPPVSANAAGAPIGTLLRGHWTCEFPGRADGPASLSKADRNFDILSGSVYAAGERRGVYLVEGDAVTMTTGPLRGTRFAKISQRRLREVTGGAAPGRLSCVYAGPIRSR